MEKIDFVVTWVDDSDLKWREKRDTYWKLNKEKDSVLSDGGDVRYKEWGYFKFWFRSVEKYAPWVNKIFLVTDHQVPDWINKENDKLRLIYHEDFIPQEFLPTFDSQTIELFFHLIPDLSDNFVYFNDDMFLTDYVDPKDFFVNDKPKCLGIQNVRTYRTDEPLAISQLIDIAVVNKYFNKKEVIKKNFFKWFSCKYGINVFRNILLFPWRDFPNLYLNHLPSNLKKKTYQEVWLKEKEFLEKSASHKFRYYADVNQWLFLFWQVCSGDFVPQNFNIGKAYCIGDNSNIDEELCDVIRKRRYKMICIGEGKDWESTKSASMRVIEAFKDAFPNESEFEKCL